MKSGALGLRCVSLSRFSLPMCSRRVNARVASPRSILLAPTLTKALSSASSSSDDEHDDDDCRCSCSRMLTDARLSPVERISPTDTSTDVDGNRCETLVIVADFGLSKECADEAAADRASTGLGRGLLASGGLDDGSQFSSLIFEFGWRRGKARCEFGCARAQRAAPLQSKEKRTNNNPTTTTVAS